MNIVRVGSRTRAHFGLQISEKSSPDFRFFSENFIKGGYLKVIRELCYVKNSGKDTICFSDGEDIVMSQNNYYKPYFFYNFNSDDKKYKLTFPPIHKKFSLKFPIDEIRNAFVDYKSRIKNMNYIKSITAPTNTYLA